MKQSASGAEQRPVSPLATDRWVTELVSGLDRDLQVAFRIGVAVRELRRAMAQTSLRERLYGIGAEALDLGQVDTLALLVLRGPLRMVEVADGLRIDPSAATRAVDRLRRAGLARRTTDRADGRAILVSATEEGRTRFLEISERQRELMFTILSGFDPSERVALSDLLERFVLALDAAITVFARPTSPDGTPPG